MKFSNSLFSISFLYRFEYICPVCFVHGNGLWSSISLHQFVFLYTSYQRFNTEIDVSFSWVCPVIDHEFRHNIVKVAVDPRGDSRVDPGADYFGNVMTKFIVNTQ